MPIDDQPSDAPQGAKLAPEQPVPDALDPKDAAAASLTIETVAEPGVASEPVTAVAKAPEDAPTKVDPRVPSPTASQTEERFRVWAGETKHLLSQFAHELQGDAGEIVAYLKARL